jgi:predicted metal-dependent HD superfamily phosphohydrolase
VRDLILATRHDVSPPAGDAALLVDVDLAILGSPVERFDEYEHQVRQEYDSLDPPTHVVSKGRKAACREGRCERSGAQRS